MSKTEGWEPRLAAFVEEKRGATLAWGQLDCCLLAADWVAVATGVDPVPEFRGGYKTGRGALPVLKRFAGGGVLAAAEKVAMRIGAEEVPVARAQRGDVMAFPADPAGGFDHGLGVCIGALSLVFGLEKVEAAPTAKAARAWRL